MRPHQAPVGFALIKATKRLQKRIAEEFAPLCEGSSTGRSGHVI